MAESTHSRIFRDGLLEGQVCLVSGSGSGLGRETALELARLGATVVGCGRREEPLAETAGLAKAMPGTFEHEAMDIRDEEAVERLIEGLLRRHDKLDVLVNNAGGQFLSPAEAISPKGFRTVTELNVQGTWQMTHAAATKAFIPQRGGKVLSITLSPHHGMPGMVHSGAARAAVENMMRTLAVEWARFGITHLRPRRRPVRDRDAADEVSEGGRRKPRAFDPDRPRRALRGARLAGRLPGLSGRRFRLWDDDHDRRRPRQLGRAVAAGGDRRRGWRAGCGGEAA